MKKIIQATNKVMLLILLVCMQVSLLAQDNAVTVTESEAKHFFSQPWVWAVGAILLLLLIAGIMSGNKNKHKEITKTTTTVVTEEKSV